MPYVRFTADPRLGNGDFESVTYETDTGRGVGIRTALYKGDTAIDEATYKSEQAAVLAHNAAIPLPAAAVVPPDPDAELAAAIRAIDTTKIVDLNTRAALDAFKTALLGTGTKKGAAKARAV